MLPLGMLHTDDNLEAPDKHTGEEHMKLTQAREN